MARQAFEDAIAELDSVSEDSYKVRYQLFCFHMLFWQLRFMMRVRGRESSMCEIFSRAYIIMIATLEP